MNESSAVIGDARVAWHYGDPAGEYAAVRQGVARFDLAAAGLLDVTGDGAFDLLQAALARDIEFVTPEQCLTSLMLSENGDVVDLVTLYLIEDGYRVETSFGGAHGTAAHLASLRAAGHGPAALVRNRSESLTTILVEGPGAARLVEDRVDPELGGIAYLGVASATWRSVALTVARSGFTGEFGYKVFVERSQFTTLWTELGEARAAGFDALECAMLEVRQPLPHREMAPGVTPLMAGYNWLIDITKDDFCGRLAVVKEFEAGLSSRLIGWAAAAGCPAERGTMVAIGGERIGQVVFARPSYGRADVLGLALVDADLAAAGIDVQLATADGVVNARTLAAPYVYPTSWTAQEAAARLG